MACDTLGPLGLGNITTGHWTHKPGLGAREDDRVYTCFKYRSFKNQNDDVTSDGWLSAYQLRYQA